MCVCVCVCVCVSMNVCVSPLINNDIIAKRNSEEGPTHYLVTGPHMLHEVVLKICKLSRCVLHVISQSESNSTKNTRLLLIKLPVRHITAFHIILVVWFILMITLNNVILEHSV